MHSTYKVLSFRKITFKKVATQKKKVNRHYVNDIQIDIKIAMQIGRHWVLYTHMMGEQLWALSINRNIYKYFSGENTLKICLQVYTWCSTSKVGDFVWRQFWIWRSPVQILFTFYQPLRFLFQKLVIHNPWYILQLRQCTVWKMLMKMWLDMVTIIKELLSDFSIIFLCN